MVKHLPCQDIDNVVVIVIISIVVAIVESEIIVILVRVFNGNRNKSNCDSGSTSSSGVVIVVVVAAVGYCYHNSGDNHGGINSSQSNSCTVTATLLQHFQSALHLLSQFTTTLSRDYYKCPFYNGPYNI